MYKNVYENSSCYNLTNSFPEMYVYGCLTRNKIYILLSLVTNYSINSNIKDNSPKPLPEVKKNIIIANLIILTTWNEASIY